LYCKNISAIRISDSLISLCYQCNLIIIVNNQIIEPDNPKLF